MLLSSFRVELDSSTRRLILNIDGDSAYAILGARDDFQAGATRRVFNWIAANTLYPSYHGKASMDSDSYGTFMKTNFPILIEAKSAGDFTNTNKRRKEEAQKIHQLRSAYGQNGNLLLFLCGYFDTGYLGYEAAEGLDWVWEHRIDDMLQLGI